MGHLLDLIACHQVKHEGAKLRDHYSSEEAEFFALMSRR